MGIEAGDDATDQVRFDERPCRVVDQHGGGRRTGECLETRVNRVLASRAASHRRPQALRKGLARSAVQRFVVGMDDHDNVVDARMLGERGDGARR